MSVDHSNHSKLSLNGFLIWFTAITVLLLGLSWLFLDEQLSAGVNRWLSTDTIGKTNYVIASIMILASDLFLPIPSSLLITHAGIHLGLWGGIMIGFLGLTIGSLIGFGLARYLGTRFVYNRVNESELEQLNLISSRYGSLAIVLLRPIPIFAEASVLLLGVGVMAFRPFLFWICLSNLWVSFIFAVLGTWAQQYDISESFTILISMAIPLLFLVLAKIYFSYHISSQNTHVDSE